MCIKSLENLGCNKTLKII